jgi:hypothetical protein
VAIRGGESISDELSDDESELIRDEGWYGAKSVELSDVLVTAVLPW